MSSLLPNNSTALETSLEATLSRDLPNVIGDLWQPSTCPEHLLGVLAWGLVVDEWDDNWPIEIKRQVCQAAVEVHQYKGTVHAIKTALNSLNTSIDLVEWFENGGQVYTATLVAYASNNLDQNGNTLLTPALQDKLWRVVKAAKNARTHLDFKVGVGVKNSLYLSLASKGLSLQRNAVASNASYPLSGVAYLCGMVHKPVEVHRHFVSVN